MADTPIPTLTSFTQGDIVVSISGDGAGTGSYGDNQASPLVLEELTPDGTVVGEMELPQTTTVVDGVTEYAVSAEYGSSSEGSLALSADGQSLVIAGYGINADTFNAGGAAVYGNPALAQSTSVPGGTDTAVARVIADISYNGTIDSSTALYNVDNLNNPRSVATVNGTSFYLAGQGTSGDTTQGVQYAQDGANSATIIDDSTDARTAEIVNGVLYVSRDSKQGTDGTSNIATYGGLPTSATAAVPLAGLDGTVTLTAAQENGVNNADVGTVEHLSPENFFFASSTVLYVADGGIPKEGGLGDGGLQKWMLVGGTWQLQYTLSAGLDLVANTASGGSTGLIGLTGSVGTDGTVTLYATNSTINDLDPTSLYSITDSLNAMAPAADESFKTVLGPQADANIRGVAFAPSAAATTATFVTVSSGNSPGLQVTSGSMLTVDSGAGITGATIFSAGVATVLAGGTDAGSTIAQGGEEILSGTATGDQVQGTQLLSAAGASASSETVYNGGAVELFLKGTTASAITVETGGALAINGSATATAVTLEGGTLSLESAKANLAGSLVFHGGTLDVTAVLAAGSPGPVVISGFGAGDVIDDSAMAAGSTFATSTTVSTTVATITNGTVTQSFTFAGTVTDLALQSDGTGGVEIVTSVAAPAAGVTVSSGVTSAGLTVASGTTVSVLSGGLLVGAMVNSGGSVLIEAGGTDSGSTLAAGAHETVSGSAVGDQVFGSQLVSAAGAAANSEFVHSGGVVDLFLKGATGSGLVVEAGGAVNVSGNVDVTDAVLSGGVLDLQSPKATLVGSLTFAGPATLAVTDISSATFGDLAVISGFQAGDVIDDTAIGATATMTTTVSGGNTVATLSGTTTQSYIFAGSSTVLQEGNDGAGGVEITAEAVTPTHSSVTSGVTGLTVTEGSTVDVVAGGTLSGATVMWGGTVTVESGGADSGSTLAAGSKETVIGTATGDRVAGTQFVSAGTAKLNGETVLSGGLVDLELKGIVTSGMAVDAGGLLEVNGNITLSNTTLSGGTVDLESAKATLTGSLTFSGGTLELTALSTTSTGDHAVLSGFSAGDVVDDRAIGAGATLGTVVSGANTVATITSGGTTQSFIFAGNVTDLALVSDNAGGMEIVVSAGAPPPPPPPTGITVSSGVTSSGLTVASGMTVTVLSGGVLDGATVQSGGTVLDSGTVSGATVQLGGMVTVAAGGVDSGSILAAGSHETVVGSATGDQVAGTQFVSAGTAVLTGETVLSGGLVDLELKGIVATGMVIDAGGTMSANGNITMSNTVLNGGTVDLASPKAALSGSLTFEHGGTLELTDISSGGTLYGDQAVISGFSAGDVVDDSVVGSGAVLTSAVVGGNTVETITSGSVSQNFTFAGTYGPGFFSLVPDGGTGVAITTDETPCYCRGTLILTDRGEVPVESLQIGDRLQVRSGALRPIRWIGRRSYSGPFAAGNRGVLPVVFRAGSLGDGVPRRDLAVSPMHAMFLDGALVPAGALVNGASIVQAEAIDRVAYFHLELASHDVIFAEGAESETFIDDESRGMFHNAAEYAALYPDVRVAAAQYCAPRVEQGPVLQAICARLAARAGVVAAPVETLRGQIEAVSRLEIRFWAWDGTDAPVRLRVIDNGVVLGEMMAGDHRADLADAGIGGGAHGCVFAVPGGLSPALRHVIEVERVADGARLANSPWVLDEAGPVAMAAAPAFSGRGRVDVATRDRVAGWVVNPAHAGPVALQVLDNGMPIASVLANGYRADLAAAGVGAGWHAFDVTIPGGLSPLSRHVISVRLERDGAELPGAPVVIEAADRFDAGLEQLVAQAVGAVGSAEERRRVLSFIAAQADRLAQLQADAESRPDERLAAWQQRRAGGVAEVAPRALVIAERLSQAGAQIRALQGLGYAVSLVAADEMAAEGVLEGVTVCGAPFYASVEEVLWRQAGGFAAVYLDGVAVASRYLTLAREHAPRARVVFGAGALRHLALARQAVEEERPELVAASRRVQMEEFRAAWAADAVVAASPEEAALLRRAVPEAVVVGALADGLMRRAG